jgi:hypothetical protein
MSETILKKVRNYAKSRREISLKEVWRIDKPKQLKSF